MLSRDGQATEFTGVRMRFDSDKPYDELVAALFEDVGSTPVPIDDFPHTTTTWTDYQRRVESHRRTPASKEKRCGSSSAIH
jgi:hypothetical protein